GATFPISGFSPAPGLRRITPSPRILSKSSECYITITKWLGEGADPLLLYVRKFYLRGYVST
ncbi:MAG: hypothetical protein QW080_03915, partial [Sulfolobales archaeon]